nr:ubiquitin hydrolase [Tanacetum cinerariifolium]
MSSRKVRSQHKVNLIYHYKLALAQVESRLVEYKEREVKYIEKIRTLEFYDKGLLTASKDLDNLIESQRSDKNKEGLGYTFVPPPIGQLYISPKKDLSWTGLPECADDTVTDYSRPSPTVESTLEDGQNRNSFASKNGEPTDSILSKPAVKFVKAAERSTLNKVEAVKKPSVRYAELYRKPSKKTTVRGNQRNCNNLKSQQLGENFVRKNRACFNCGHFDHLSSDCGLGVKKGTTRPQNNTHKSMPPRPSIHKPYRPPMRPELMIILIHRVQRLEMELKARTPIHKVDRGRSRPVMDWVPKKV